MAGCGPAPKPDRRRSNVPERGQLVVPDGSGWQHGSVPKPPAGLLKASKDAWSAWMGAWFAAFWTPEDLPGLRQVVRLYDQVERAPDNASLHTQLRQMMDTYGITPKGQQDRRWVRPEQRRDESKTADAPYGHLKVVGD